MLSLLDIERTLDTHTPERLPVPPNVKKRASVAMTFAGAPDALHICLIERAQRPGDRWSGQMAFPGGRASPEDDSPLEVAIRETREEVGLSLHQARPLGALSELALDRHGDDSHGVLSPFVFYSGDRLPALTPEPGEVARAFWIPLTHLYDPTNLEPFRWEVEPGEYLDFPGIRYDTNIIWGLTHRLLMDFTTLLGRPLPL